MLLTPESLLRNGWKIASHFHASKAEVVGIECSAIASICLLLGLSSCFHSASEIENEFNDVSPVLFFLTEGRKSLSV